MTLFAGQLSYIAVSVLTIKLLYTKRFSFTAALLTGLLRYEISSLPGDEQTSTTQGTADGGSTDAAQTLSRKRKKKIEQQRRKQIDLGVAEKILQVPVTKASLEQTEFYEVFDTLVFFGLLIAVNSVAGIVGKEVFGVVNSLQFPLTACGVLVGVYSLAKVEVFSGMTPKSERWYISMITAASFVLSLGVFLVGPQWLFDFKADSAANALSTALNAAMKQKAQDGADVFPEVNVDSFVTVTGVCATASLIGGLVFTATTRVVRCSQLIFDPPVQLKEHIAVQSFWPPLINLQIVLTMICVVFWMEPMVEIFELDRTTLQYLRGGLFLLWGTTQFALLRPYMQSYLHGALVQWYNLRNSDMKKSDEDQVSRQMQMKVAVNTFLLCKVAVQLLAPAIIVVSFGLLILSRGVAGAMSEENPLFPPEFVYFFAGLSAWWLCLSWGIYSILILSLFRIGVLVS